MKKTYLSVLLGASVLLWACNNAGEGSSNVTTDTSTTADGTGSAGTGMTTDTGASTGMTTTTNTPLSSEDREFVIKAANGGMMELETGRIAQENASSQRIKDFGGVLIRDHSKANDELKSLASSKGLTIPEDSLMNKNKDHLEAMRKMKGKEFDSHFKSMMLNDHKKDVNEFEKASKNLNDPDLKAWATKTLPTLRMHLDSMQALNKAKM